MTIRPIAGVLTRTLAVLLTLVLLPVLGGCVINRGDGHRGSPGGDIDALRVSFIELSRTLPGMIGLAVAPVGGDRDSAVSFGVWNSGAAWSTIKVPLALAALRTHNDRADLDTLVHTAITESDNDAAEQLWSRLGPPEQAAEQVQTILREAGDEVTTVETHPVRPEFSTYGQTRWSLKDQARFAAALPCLPDGDSMLELMHDVIEEQRWGLNADGMAAKSGWGPGEHEGGYLVRQFGIISTSTGDVGVAMAVEPDAGTLEAGTAMFRPMTAWLISHEGEFPSGGCPARR